MKTDDGLYVNIHEAAVLDFPTMNLDLDPDRSTLKVHLTPDATGYVGRLTSPCYSPWRTVQVCEKATDVLRSRLILNLNEPCALEDVSWIHPVKYMGVWWEMISDHSTWGYTNDFPSVRLPGDPSLPPSLQGAITDYSATIKKRKAEMKESVDLIEQIIQEGAISDANLRLLVDSIVISEKDKKLHIKINLNAKFERHKDCYDEEGNLTERMFIA